MLCSRNSVLFAIALTSITIDSTVVDAKGPKSHWYVDPVFSSRPQGNVECPAYQTTTVHLAVTKPPLGCIPSTEALMRIWVNERATVWINGHRTKPQFVAGVNRGSRVFSLTGLSPDAIQEAVIEVSLDEAWLSRRELVQAGQSYTLHIADELLPQPVPEPPEAISPLVDEEVQRAERAGMEAQQAEANAKDAERGAADARLKAEGLVQKAQSVIDEKISLLEKLAASATAAQHAAIQAARTNSEAFQFVQDHKPVVAWVKYKDDGTLAEIHFDGATTPANLEFRETSGSLAHLNGVAIDLIYHFTVQIPDPAQPDGFKEEELFDIKAQSATFERGIGRIQFFDKDAPDKFLSSLFKHELKKRWSRVYDGKLVKVEIRAIRPNETETQVAPKGNRITIEFHAF